MTEHPCADHAPAERRMVDLSPDELFVVGAVRAWVAPHLRPGAAHPDWRELFRLARIGAPGMAGFELLMSVLGAEARRLLEVRCRPCPSVGPDEEAMLRLVVALQAGRTDPALGVLGDWLPAAAVAPALRGAIRFAEAAHAAGFRLVALDDQAGRQGRATPAGPLFVRVIHRGDAAPDGQAARPAAPRLLH